MVCSRLAVEATDTRRNVPATVQDTPAAFETAYLFQIQWWRVQGSGEPLGAKTRERIRGFVTGSKLNWLGAFQIIPTYRPATCAPG
jgi:hypothetical protein